VIAFRKGSKSRKKLMLAAHMDEVAFMVTGFGAEGLLKFKPVGGVDPRVMLSQRVFVGKERLPGAVVSKPIHLQPRGEQKAVLYDSMLIDIGAANEAEAKNDVKKG